MYCLTMVTAFVLTISGYSFDPELFKDPSSEHRPAPFWFWNDVMKKDEINRQLQAFKEVGLGGVMLHPRFGLGGPYGQKELEYYLSNEYFEMVGYTIEQAKKLGLDLWLYDDYNWPSGYGGGRVLLGGIVGERTVPPNPEYRAQHIVCESKAIRGPYEYYQEVPKGKLIRAFAMIRERDKLQRESQIDLTDHARNGHFRWDAPEGNWSLMFFMIRDSAHCPAHKQDLQYVDLMNRDCIAKFIDITHAEYYRRFGKEFGKTIKGIFTDEPAYFNNNIWKEDPNTLPWTSVLFDTFKERKGYDLHEALPALWFEVEELSHKVRADFWDVASWLYQQNFFKQIHDFCARHKILSIGHVLEENFRFHRCFEGGDFYRTMRYLDMAGIDQIGNRDFGRMNPKFGSSARALFDNINRVLSETYGAYGWDTSMEDMREILNWQAVRGVNFQCPHAFYYSIRGPRKHDAPPDLFYHNFWRPYFRIYADYCGRLNYVTSEGSHVADVAVLYPVTGITDSGPPDAFKRIEDMYRKFEQVCDVLIEHQRDFNYIPETALITQSGYDVPLDIKDGKLIVGKGRYSTVVIPPTEVLDLRAVLMLELFVHSGGKVIVVRELPLRDPYLPATELPLFWKKTFGEGARSSKESIVKQRPSGGTWIFSTRSKVRDEYRKEISFARGHARYTMDWVAGFADVVVKHIPTEVEVETFTPQLTYRHHRIYKTDVYLLVNESREHLRTKVSLAVDGAPLQADPLSGEVKPCKLYKNAGGKTTVSLLLKPYQSTIMIFKPDNKAPVMQVHDHSGQIVSLTDDTVTLLIGSPGEAFAAGQYKGNPFRVTHNVTDSLEPMTIKGEFEFSVPGEPSYQRNLTTWIDKHPRYSGWATYRKEFDVDTALLGRNRRLILDLGEVNELAEVTVNNKTFDPLLWVPYRVDVTEALKPGQNKLSIRVCNTWVNQFDNRPLPSGLLEPIKLVPMRVVELKVKY